MTLSMLAALSIAGALPNPAQQGGAAAPATTQDDTYSKSIQGFTAQDGVFKVWRNKELIMYEIPTKMMGRDFLWVTELKKTPAGMYNGSAVAENVVRWEVRDDKVLLRVISYRVRSTQGGAIAEAVEQSNVSPIIRTFDIKARSKSGDPLIDVGSFYKSDIPEFSVRGAVSGTQLDSSRTFLERVVAFPNNINVEVLQTFLPGQGSQFASFFGGATGSNPRTVVVSHSMCLLPEKPMMGRLADSRVGYFSTPVVDYGTDYHGVKEYAFINRHRLEKKDPTAAMSEPVKPIVYYISREVPEKWRAACKQGVEDWNVAFEAAGFKNAIIAKDAPTEKEDPNWSPEDARYNVIRWAPLPIANAMGPSTADPRSGEIINAHIIMWHDILKLQTDWYFSQASPNDPRARRLPFSDELQSELLRFVVAHEVGHTLGLPHNGKSSATVPIASLRNPNWCKENGTATTIMDYARFNYVTQPGDGVAAEDLVPKIGKYDKFSIKWGYAPIPSVRDPWGERQVLDAWAAAQVSDPQLRFYDNFSSSDPTAQAEALGDDAVEASRLGVLNLMRVMGYVAPATVRIGEDYDELSRLHGQIVGQFQTYLGHVTAVVGGIEQIDYRGGRGGAVYNPVSRDYQRRAVRYVVDQVFTTPTWLFPKDILDKFSQDMGANRLRNLQRAAVNSLLSDARLNRMLQNETHQLAPYTVNEMLSTLRGAVWAELNQANPKVDFFRRGLQREWIAGLTRKLGNTSDIRALAMVELEIELATLKKAIARTTDTTTRGHLMELRASIEFGLANPDKMGAGGSPAQASPFGIDELVVKPTCPTCAH